MTPFSKEDFRALVDRPHDLSVSIYMPTEKAGKETQQNSIRFKNLVRRAAARIEEGKLLRPREVKQFLQPAHRLIDDSPFWLHQKDGLALFVGRDVFRYYKVPLRLKESLVVNERFYVKPLLRLLTGDGRFYVLSLSRKQVKLYEGTRFSMSEVDLGDTPKSFLDVVGSELEEQHLQLHTSTSQHGGARQAQFHGQGGGEDDVKPEIRKFFAAVDRGLKEVLQDTEAPLVLAGLEYLAPIYREASTLRNLLDEEVRINAADMAPDELHDRAWSIVQPQFLEEQRRAEELFRELAGTGRTSEDVGEIVAATHNGRVDTLFLARGAQRWGRFDHQSQRVELEDGPRGSSQDLLDFAAVQTLLHSGKVYVVEPDRLPRGGVPAAALFRY